jgi:hypothetical protein
MGFGMERAVGLSENLRRGENERVFFMSPWIGATASLIRTSCESD